MLKKSEYCDCILEINNRNITVHTVCDKCKKEAEKVRKFFIDLKMDSSYGE